MAMTLKEQDAAATKKREALWKRDKLVEQLATARMRLSNLELRVAQPDGSRVLEEILELAQRVPSNLLTHGIPPFVTGGLNTQDEMKRISRDALADLVRARQQLAESLTQAQQKLAECEAAWTRFQEANPEIEAAA